MPAAYSRTAPGAEVHWKHEPLLCCMVLDGFEWHTRLHRHRGAVRINGLDCRHAFGAEHDVIGTCKRAFDQAGIPSDRDDALSGLMAQRHHARHLLGRRRPDDGTPPGPTTAAISAISSS